MSVILAGGNSEKESSFDYFICLQKKKVLEWRKGSEFSIDQLDVPVKRTRTHAQSNTTRHPLARIPIFTI
jgi:hypothetical protein